MNRVVVTLVAGALAMFYLDPDRGAYRRNVTRDRMQGTLRRFGKKLGRGGRHVTADAAGTYQRVASAARRIGEGERSLDDATLAAKVQTEIFRDPDVPKGQININAVDGVVYLRGQARRPSEIKELERRVRAIDGVVGVENLLHLPDTPVRRS